MNPDGEAFGSWGGPSENVNKLAPELINEAFYWPFDGFPTDNQDKQADFMNYSPHPRQYYSAVQISVAIAGNSFLEMPIRTYIDGPSATGISIWSKRDCSVPNNTGIGISMTLPTGSVGRIERLSDKEWMVSVNQPVKLLEFGYQSETTQWHNKTITSCDMYLKGGWFTKPISYSLIVTGMPN